jgi:EAL domain-containing protein (putative c-di-GMP-specific phosphodiesterase class I)
MGIEMGNGLARGLGVLERRLGLTAQPQDDRDASEPVHHEQLVRVAHDTSKLHLHDLV